MPKAGKRLTGAKTAYPPSAPISLTIEEIKAKGRGGDKANVVTKRIGESTRSKNVGQLRSGADVPVAISRSEMVAIRKRGKPTAKVLARVKSSGTEEPVEAKRRRRPKAKGARSQSVREVT